MRLSEAIRLGAMLKPQAFGDYTDGIGSCAWGAANEAMGRPVDHEEVDDAWLVMLHPPVAHCPACGIVALSTPIDDAEGQGAIAFLVEHLNDDHRWTREAIADWVETIEQQQEQATVIETPDPVSVTA